MERRLQSGAYLLRVMRFPEIGFEWFAACERCSGSGCFDCDYRQYRQLTEDEEYEVYEMQGRDTSKRQ